MSGETSLGSAVQLAELITRLAGTIDARADSHAETSYTAELLQDGPLKCGQKIAEEGVELALALVAQGQAEAAAEAADLLYHILVGLRVKGVSLDQVADVLAERQGVSGLTEKANRTTT